MAKTIQSTGEYTSKKSGQAVSYEFEYQAFDSLDDAIEILGEDKALATIQRMVKVDANNTAREKAKVVNGDSERKPMSEQEKAEAKAKRQADRKLLDMLKQAGLDEKGLQELIA